MMERRKAIKNATEVAADRRNKRELAIKAQKKRKRIGELEMMRINLFAEVERNL